MKIGDVVSIEITNRAICPCGCENKGAKFTAVYIGLAVSDFGVGRRFEPVDYVCSGCGVPVVEHIEYDSANATDESVSLRSVPVLL